MNQNLCRSLSTVVLLCAAGMPLSASAEQTPENAHATVQETLEIAVEQSDAATTELVPESPNSARSTPDSTELSEDFRITTHTLEGRRIAIFYVDDLPVLTFVEQSEADTPAEKEAVSSAAIADDPSVRAAAFARQIDEFYRVEGDPNALNVKWDAEAEAYVMTLEGEPLAQVNDATRYFNTTGDHAADALQATNRLRTLLGASEPLTEIEGQPEPEPEVAAQADWGVISSFAGQASWYGPGFHGRQTASGERFNQNALTAAHRTLPFGTRVRVTNVRNNRYVIVRINDRGPFSGGRVIDLSAGAAREIGLHRAGVGPVRVEVLSD